MRRPTHADRAPGDVDHPLSLCVLRRLAVFGVVLIALQVFFFVLLLPAQAVPDGPIVSRLVSAVEDETYGPTSGPDQMGGIAATHSECNGGDGARSA